MPRKKREMRGYREKPSDYLRPEVADYLRKLSAETDISDTYYIREAIDDLLHKYKVRVP